MKPYGILVLSLIAFSLSACDPEKASNVFIESKNQPDIYFGSGISLLIAERQTAKVFGSDECPEQGVKWLFGPTINEGGCTLLTGMKTVDVRLEIDDGTSIQETWVVKEGVGPTSAGIQLSRPNGWILREPEG